MKSTSFILFFKSHPNLLKKTKLFWYGLKPTSKLNVDYFFEPQTTQKMKTSSTIVFTVRPALLLFTLASLLLVTNVSGHTTGPVVSISNDTNKKNTTSNQGIVYASLAANVAGNSVFINWITASESNNSHFEVERSFDLSNFETVALVLDGFAAEGTGKTYRFKESAGAVKKAKVVYYRLKQIDVDGQVNYSPVMTVRLSDNPVAATAPALVTPNPINTNTAIHFNSAKSGNVEIRIINVNGQTLLSKQSVVTKGNVNMPVEGGSISFLPVYILPV